MGSPALLLARILEEMGFEVRLYDPYVDAGPCPFNWPGVYFVATNHKQFAAADWEFPQGAVVLDPWRYIPERAGVNVVHIGISKSAGGVEEAPKTAQAGAASFAD